MNAVDELLRRWGATPAAILRGMAALPYENLSKALERGRPRDDDRVASDHLESGTGGTCFALVSLFLALARRAGLIARPVLADRSYGADTHCAAIVESRKGPLLADPGFLVHVPVPLAPGAIDLPFARLTLEADGSVWTRFPNGHRKFRYRLKTDRISDADFRARWDDSFEWEMMSHAVVTRVVNGTHVYLRDRWRHETTREGTRRRDVDPLEEAVAMGIDRRVAEPALAELGWSTR